ncbi:histidine kinase [Methylobacterium mesophilicum SR1.6/6]|uniref:Histidine kinase n=1 Tax=Methylobacterium mesophilicum SR1.6/6 TaxID=908290 RepID=A0A6B9FN59_9HYPH|nr:signal transduction histidine kinase [Methylobacterium mesophilicum]QGY02398.1 histidine kinase [Methylobacterium mesophilicum SR1.6/6]
MADYYPLLARALDALPDRTPALRKAVYDRARNALIGQLRSLDPPLSEADIDLERRALDAAIERLEVDYGGLPAPANDAANGAEPPKPPVSPAAEIPEPSPPEPVLPAAKSPFEPPRTPDPKSEPAVDARPGPEPEPREATIPIAPRRPGPVPAAPPVEPEAPGAMPAPDDTDLAGSTEAGNGRQRPRIEVVPPRTGRSRMLRNVFVGSMLAVVIGLIAVAAFLLRDRPQILPSTGTETADTQQPEGETKFGDRVGGDAAPAPKAAPRPEGSAPPRAAAAPSDPSIAVAQRAELIEETAGADGGQPTSSPGRVTWRLDTVNGEQGQPLQNAVVATVTIPEAGLTLVMTIQRNLDATLPASHTVSLAFSQTGGTDPVRTVQDVGLLQAKDEQNARGSPVSGLPVRVRDNLFLIGLSSLQNDVERNTDLLLHRNWFDLALRYTNGRRAVLTFEKGSAGAQVMQSAFDAWQ